MDGHTYIQWIQHQTGLKIASAAEGTQFIVDSLRSQVGVVPTLEDGQQVEILTNGDDTDFLVDGADGEMDMTTEAADLDQIAAENLIFMASDGKMVSEIIATAGTDDNGAIVVAASDGTPIDCAAVLQQAAGVLVSEEDDAIIANYAEEFAENTPQMVTEEVITDDWVPDQGEERVEIPADQIIGSNSQELLDIEVPLPTVQDEYTALRPYPCDFCSRRFRKKATLMNHMVAHQNDRPHLCKLCGSRFLRRFELINHLKAHAEAPDPEFDDAEFIEFVEQEQEQQQQRPANDHYYEQDHDWSMHPDAITVPTKAGRRVHNNNGNSLYVLAPITATRGRFSRLKPKEENYTIDETCQQEVHSYGEDLNYVQCQELQPAPVSVDGDSSVAVVATIKPSVSEEQPKQVSPNDRKPFVCLQCGLAFSREKAFLSHGKTHQNDAPHECTQCNEIFWDAASLQEHQKSHDFEESNSEYDPAEAEESQSESESDPLYGEFYCSECGVSFHRQDLLRRHSKTHEKHATENVGERNQGSHCCNTCGETFAEALDLLAHAEIHARYPPFKCVLCGESFFEEQTIKRHLQTQHSNELSANSCVLCGKSCRDRKALMKHSWDHSREKCHLCSKCGKNFHNKARLKRHMTSHRDKSVTCDVCHEEFPDGRSLSNHRHSHSTNAAGKQFPCHECGKTFGSRSSQQIHVRIHTGERPYGCRFCWKAFADGGTLRKHERIHTGEKPYGCSVCPRAFNQRVVLREHIRSHHSRRDAQRGTYFCTVCSATMTSSNELVQHLIKHSDTNTAMQRQPIAGPRKYKRRRKLKPQEIARLRDEGKRNDVDLDLDVDDLLDTVEATLPAKSKVNSRSTTTKGKRGKVANVSSSSRNHSGNKFMSTAGGKKDRLTMGIENDGTVDEDEEAEEVEEEEENEELEVDVGGSERNQSKKRYNSTSNSSEKLWQTKLINSNTHAETYKSLLSNLENTLQSIDTLVVGGKHSADDQGFDIVGDVNGDGSRNGDADCTAQRTQRIQINKTDAPSRARKKTTKHSKPTRPRMIHTEKSRITVASSDGSKRRSKCFITRTEPTGLGLLSAKTRSTIADDYEIMSPDTRPPKQISCSPLYAKQDYGRQQQQQQQYQQQQHQTHSIAHASRSSDLYDAQLLLEAAELRKEAYEKFNPSIVNDLEEILRSPVKSDKSGRLRFVSESSSTQLLGEQSEEERNMIKIEPTSPNLHEIITGSSSVSDNGCMRGISVDSPGALRKEHGVGERRSTRNRLVTANRKYLEFTGIMDSVSTSSTAGAQQKRNSASAPHSARRKNTKKPKKEAPKPVKSYPFILDSAFNANPNHSAVPSPAASSSFLTISSVSGGTSMTQSSGGSTANVTSALQQPQRRQRYFECEMCSAVFPDRAQLLDHVPIHI